MVIPSLETSISTNGIHMDSDKNDLYVIRKCIVWLKRHVLRYPCLDSETMKLMCWILGEDMQELGNHLLSQIPEKRRERYVEELSESALNPDDYGPDIAKLLRKSPSINKLKFARYAARLMDRKFAKIKYYGKSEIEKNILALKKLFDLNDRETELCTFFFISNAYSYTEDYFITHMECHRFAGQKYLANIIGFSKQELHSIVYGKLKRIGLYDVDKWGIIPEDTLLNLILNPSEKNLSSKFYIPVSKPSVPLKDFLIGKELTDHMLELLGSQSKSPTHILLYGPPGTGKTSFAYSLLNKLKVPSFEIIQDDENTTTHRRAAIIACLNMTNYNQGSVVLVDEADNLLNTQSSWFMRGETQDKGWLNQLLDEPGTRMIWVTNRIDDIEDSVLRRFAFSLIFKPFNRLQRVSLWDSILRKNRCKRYFNQNDIEDFAKRYDVSAGVIDLAVKKALEGASPSKSRFMDNVKMAIESYETLINKGEKPINKDEIERNYCLDGLNVDRGLDAMIIQLEAFDDYLRNDEQNQIRNMNLLFYGPSGTGKSELARYIANRLDRKIICKRVSDLQSMYVGEGEKNIKLAFQEADSEDAVLIIDEADSLLFSRDRARHSWEISFTNEFLNQTERFRGILVCTTNRLDDFDSAAIRRFNHKIGFDYLTAGGNLLFYDLFLKPMTFERFDLESRKDLERIKNLTPGDFKLVRDRYSFHPRSDINHSMLIDSLRNETKLKTDLKQSRQIGF